MESGPGAKGINALAQPPGWMRWLADAELDESSVRYCAPGELIWVSRDRRSLDSSRSKCSMR